MLNKRPTFRNFKQLMSFRMYFNEETKETFIYYYIHTFRKIVNWNNERCVRINSKYTNYCIKGVSHGGHLFINIILLSEKSDINWYK